jgi:hypothetical protein
VLRSAADHDDGWHVIGEASSDGARLLFDDTDVVPGSRYGYRLQVDGEYLTAIAWIDVPFASRLAVHVAGANPVRGALALDVDVPANRAAALEVLDVAGRRALVRALPASARVRHRVDMPETATLAAGVYWVRLATGGDAVSRRVVMVR